MSTGAALQLAFIFFLVMLRLFERAMERSIRPFDPLDRITDWRLPMDRTRDRTAPKDLTQRDYDPIAQERLRKVLERRRQKLPDTGQRRRKSDKK